jgi:hypothetical protein
MKILKPAEIQLWLALERLAKWVLAHPSREVKAAQRRRVPVHTEAWRKCIFVRDVQLWIRDSEMK